MKIAFTFAAAIGVLIAPLPSLAQNQQNQQQQQQQQKKKPPVVQQKQPVVQQKQQQRVQQNQQQFKKQNVQQQKVIRQQNVQQQKVIQQKNVQQNNKKTVIINNNKPPRQVTFSSNRQTFAGTKARSWSRNGNWNFRGRNYSYWRGGPYRYRYNNTWRTYVALSALTAIAVGGATYYPYAYVSAPQDVCEGITEDGCQLTWTEAETLEGDIAPVCVTYCPWQ